MITLDAKKSLGLLLPNLAVGCELTHLPPVPSFLFTLNQCASAQRLTQWRATDFNLERKLSVANLSSENNFADVSTECSSRHQGESERSAKEPCYL